MAFDGRRAIIDIDDDEKTVYFDTYKLKKITGTRVAPILGIGEFSSPFKVACELAGLYPGDRANKYTEAGNIAEPLIRDYAKASSDRIAGLLGYGSVIIEDPVPGESCGYDHFHNEKLFGGLVDGYIVNDGKRSAVLEIKTSSSRERWEDSDGGYSEVPEAYMLQASLYAVLSGLDGMVFAVGFLEEKDYDRPKQWVPDENNTYFVYKKAYDMAETMEKCTEWYNEYMKNGYTPEWTDADEAVVKYLKAFRFK